MTQTQMVGYLVEKIGIDKKQAKLTLDELNTLVVRELKKEGSIRLAGLGIFRKRKLKARMGRNGRADQDSGAHAAALHSRQSAQGLGSGCNCRGCEGETGSRQSGQEEVTRQSR
jgi:nucleoid DNA-binding protein